MLAACSGDESSEGFLSDNNEFEDQTNLGQRLFALGQNEVDSGVQLYLAATGNDVTPLSSSDLSSMTVTADGRALDSSQYTVVSARSGSAFMSISFISDYSGSMGDGDLSVIRTLYADFAEGARGLFEGELITFDDTATVRQAFTDDTTLLVNAINNDSTYSRGATALYDGMALGITNLTATERIHPVKLMIVSTDGLENSSTISKGDLVTQVEASGAFVLILGSLYADAKEMEAIAGSRGGFIYSYSLNDAKEIALKVLEALENAVVVTLDSSYAGSEIVVSYGGQSQTF